MALNPSKRRSCLCVITSPSPRLVPEPQAQNALEVLGDLYRTLDDETADALVKAIDSGKKTKRGTLSELRNPWAS